MINKISFKGYKCFQEQQELELKPITILIGKNSSGKSAITKLPVLIEDSLSRSTPEPISYTIDKVELGAEYRDLFYGKPFSGGIISLSLESESDILEAYITFASSERASKPLIYSWKFNDSHDLQYNDTSKAYRNRITGKELNCEFKGLLPKEFNPIQDEMKEIAPNIPETFNLKANYIGPFRIFAQEMRLFPLSTGISDYTKVGVDGRLAYDILAKESLESNSDILDNVSKWTQENFEGWAIKVDIDKKPYYSVNLYREKPSYFSINISDVGQGISQALPLVVSAFIPDNKRLTIIEQPELHLHPAAHGNLAQLFAETALKYEKKYLIETHSQNFVLRLRRLVAEQKISNNDVAIYWIDNDEESNSSNIRAINIDEYGNVDYWPENVFSEALDESIAIRTAQIERT